MIRLSRSDLYERVGIASRLVFGRTIYRGMAAILLLIMVSCGVILWQYWINMVEDAQSRASTLAYLLAEQTTRTFQAADLTLLGLEAVYNAAPLPAQAPAFDGLLSQRVAELDFIHALYVVDASGRVIQTSGQVQEAVSAPSARHYLDAFNRDPRLKVLIGQPLFSQPGMLSAIPVLRRLSTAGSRPAGMIVASVDPKYFRDFYRAVDLGRRGSIDLYQDNGSILLASSGARPASALPSMDPPAPMFDTDTRLGLLRPTSAAADRDIVVYHRAQGYPLVVAVGIPIGDLWSRWWGVAAPTLAAAAIAMAMGIAIAVLVARRLDERSKAQKRAMVVQKLEALGQMTASVSHDFRNLLAVMRSTLRLVRKHGPTDHILSAAEEAIDRGSGLVTQLLAFSRRHALDVGPADINALLSGIGQVLVHAAGPGVTLVIHKTPDLPLCKADQTQFDAAMMNLVINARQAMPKGGTVSISTACGSVPQGERPEFVELRIGDTGTGIAPGDLKRIFEPFFTTKAESGTGLGLSQVYGFMQQIGGDVTVSSVVGVGTTFTLLFPIMDADAPRGTLSGSVHPAALPRPEESLATPQLYR